MTAELITSILQTATNFGVLGIVFWLFVSGRIHSDDEMKTARADLDAERHAHELTRQALSLANERANNSVLTGELVLRALKPTGV